MLSMAKNVVHVVVNYFRILKYDAFQNTIYNIFSQQKEIWIDSPMFAIKANLTKKSYVCMHTNACGVSIVAFLFEFLIVKTSPFKTLAMISEMNNTPKLHLID